MNKLTKKITHLLLEEINKDYIIYFDVDDTLTNYSENLSTVMVNDKETNEKRPIKASDTANNLDFWLNAKPLPGVKEMVKFAQNNFNQVKILSAVPELSKAKKEETGERFYEAPIKGKTEWLNRNVGPIEKIWVKSGKEKDVYAKPNTVLVDDKMDNIKYFEQAGGIGILFDNSQNVINKLKQLKSPITENTTYSGNIDYKQQIKDLTRFYLKKYPNLKQLPKVIFKNGDVENAQYFFGKTAYYDPNTKTIVLYTEGRHPRDITSSFSHEFIHFLQDMEGRLGDIQTTNTNEDGNLQNLEKEAYLEGNINFRNWKDSLKKNNIKESQVNFSELEKYLDTIFEEYGIDVSFSKHFKAKYSL